ncbi:MAG: glycerol-3-phosphate 1-O-acyltransferase PlsY [Rickettsiales bacterium]|nr:glycerol-3-phosphate 1-O-acyltransferase PlsY [Rickettsiales bacterium]
MFNFACSQGVSSILVLCGYLFGSIPFGLIFSKLLGHGDLRKSGSGNIGATNALRTGGKLLGILTLMFDALKGVMAICLSWYFCDDYLLQIYVGVAAIIGHVFPVWLGFKGGKGVATSLAVIVVLNWHVGVVSCIIWLLTLAATRISAVSALVSFVLTPIATYFITYDDRLVVMTSFVAILIVIRHISNIKNIIASK